MNSVQVGGEYRYVHYSEQEHKLGGTALTSLVVMMDLDVLEARDCLREVEYNGTMAQHRVTLQIWRHL